MIYVCVRVSVCACACKCGERRSGGVTCTTQFFLVILVTCFSRLRRRVPLLRRVRRHFTLRAIILLATGRCATAFGRRCSCPRPRTLHVSGVPLRSGGTPRAAGAGSGFRFFPAFLKITCVAADGSGDRRLRGLLRCHSAAPVRRAANRARRGRRGGALRGRVFKLTQG